MAEGNVVTSAEDDEIETQSAPAETAPAPPPPLSIEQAWQLFTGSDFYLWCD